MAVVPVAPSGGSGTGTNPFGLGAWDNASIDVSGFPPTVVQALTQAGINTSQPVKADAVAKALEASKDTQAIAQLQQMLFYAGFYPSTVSTLAYLQRGTLRTDDTTALQNSIIETAKTAQPLGSYLTGAATTGYAQGKLNSLTPSTQANIITTPNDDAVNAALKAQAESILGHDLPAAQYAQFRAMFDAQYVAGQKATILANEKAQAGVDANQLPGASQLGQAISDTGIGPLGAAGAISQPPSTVTPTSPLGFSQQSNGVMAGNNGQGSGPGLNAVANPALAAYQARIAQDQGTINQFNQGANALNTTNGITSVEGAPDASASAAAFIQANDAQGVTAQNNIGKYSTLMDFLKGDGSVK